MDKIEVINIVPKFLAFFEQANKEIYDMDDKWQLWEEHYNFAAVPPGDEGKVLGRSLFEDAWDRYESWIPYFESWNPDEQAVRNILTKVKNRLGCTEELDFVVLYFVGAFDDNPFVAPYGEGRLALCLPIETDNTEVYLAHELTHIVHAKVARLSPEWERTIASVILQEGLATRVSESVVPGRPEKDYIESTAGWLKSAQMKKKEIISGIIPYLSDSSSETVMKFTFGGGTTDHEREAYFVGWEFVKGCLDDGVTFEELARVKEEAMPGYVMGKIGKYLDGKI